MVGTQVELGAVVARQGKLVGARNGGQQVAAHAGTVVIADIGGGSKIGEQARFVGLRGIARMAG